MSVVESAVASKVATQLLTRSTFHAARFWLKADAPLNMLAMFDTDAVFQFFMSALNVGWLLNSELMLVTAAVFQSPMFPYVVAEHAGSVTEVVTAAAMLASVMHVVQSELTVHVATFNNGHAVRRVAPHAV